MVDEQVKTRRSLIDGPYPDVPVDTPSSESWRTLEHNSYRKQRSQPNYNCTGIGHRTKPLLPGLALYPNITHTGGGSEFWKWLPSTDAEGFNPADRREFYKYTEYTINEIDRWQHVNNIGRESCDVASLIDHLRGPLKTLAGFAQKNTTQMTLEEKKALLHCISVTGPKGWKMPEMFVRFINPLGSMGKVESYEGINAYFYDLGHRFQHHSKFLRYHTNDKVNNPLVTDVYLGPYVCDRKDAEKNVNDFFKRQAHMNLPEAARLLGQAALHWGMRKESPDAEIDAIIKKAKRFHQYLFVSKAVQLIKERAYGENKHEWLVIPKEDAEIIRNYGSGQYAEYENFQPIQAEQALMDEIKAMLTPGAPEYQEMQRLLKGGDGAPGDFKFRVYLYDMMREYKHAMNFLLPNDEEGKKFVFGR